MDLERDRFQNQSYKPVQVTPLTGACLTIDGRILSLSGKDMELILDRHVAPGTPVRVQARNWLMLGDVLYCAPERSSHQARLRLEHALPSLRELSDRNRHFFGQTARAPLSEMGGYSGWT